MANPDIIAPSSRTVRTAISIPTKFPPPCFTISPATCIEMIMEVIQTIVSVIGKDETPKREHCSTISLKEVL